MFPLLKPKVTIPEQINKVQEELYEIREEAIHEDYDKMAMETLDLITTGFNLLDLINPKEEVIDRWVDKMLKRHPNVDTYVGVHYHYNNKLYPIEEDADRQLHYNIKEEI